MVRWRLRLARITLTKPRPPPHQDGVIRAHLERWLAKGPAFREMRDDVR